jgi:hypothetical protein
VTFAPKTDVSFKKKPIKPNKTRFEVVFLGGFFGVLLGRFFWAGFLLPTLIQVEIHRLVIWPDEYRANR